MVTKWIKGEPKEFEKKICWHKHVGGLLNIEFFQIPNPTWSSGNDYYRPKSCTVNYEACKEIKQEECPFEPTAEQPAPEPITTY